MEKAAVALVTRDRDLRDAVLSSAAAVDVEVPVIESMLGSPPCPELALIGADLAADVARCPEWQAASPILVGFDAGELARWSMSMDARVIVLPDGARWLGALLAGESAGGQGAVVALVGGSGGLGVSTLAWGIAAAAARRGVSAAVVDGDPRSGGLDLLCGAERMPGWRWPELAHARGQTAELGGQLPRVDGVDVVSMGRLALPPPPEARSAVLASLRRSHALVMLDAGRGEGGLPPEVESVLLLAGRRVADVAGARETVRGLPAVGVVVRAGHGSVRADEVAAALALPLWGTVPDDPAVARGAEAGTPPSLAGRRKWQHVCEELAARLVGEAA